MAGHTFRRPAELSGGRQQREAIAVAPANGPSVVFADEQPGELDSGTAEEVFAVLRGATEHLGTTIAVVPHDRDRVLLELRPDHIEVRPDDAVE